MPVRVAALVPHFGLYGGILRYVELGNALVARGWDFSLATPEPASLGALPFRGRVATFADVAAAAPDVLIASEQSLFDAFLDLPATHRLFYFIIEGTKREKEIARTEGLRFLANSTGMTERLRRRYGLRANPVIGGVNPALFHPLTDGEAELRPPGRFTVLTNGRFRKRRKGTRIVARAIDRLARREKGLELRLFDSSTVGHRAGLPEDFRCRARVRFHADVPRGELRRLYGSSDVYVAAERKAGWSNMSIEAMACGVPVICTASGTRDFAVDGETALVVPRRAGAIARAVRRLRADPALRERLATAGRARAAELTWERAADRLAAVIEEVRGATGGGPAAPGAPPSTPAVS